MPSLGTGATEELFCPGSVAGGDVVELPGPGAGAAVCAGADRFSGEAVSDEVDGAGAYFSSLSLNPLMGTFCSSSSGVAWHGEQAAMAMIARSDVRMRLGAEEFG
jgi:hypothetical protein